MEGEDDSPKGLEYSCDGKVSVFGFFAVSVSTTESRHQKENL